MPSKDQGTVQSIMSSPDATIVFGPTGNVGSATARCMRQHGTRVVLAMRDPRKPIPGLTASQEAEAQFERVQADLTKPETINSAVTQTKAKRAFIYVAFGTPDNMRASVTALQSAGIEFVVLLSSDAIQGSPRDVSPADFVAWAHAQVEINLEEIFGPERFVAVRPTYFASNALWWKRMISEGEVRMAYPNAKFDWISPEDIGVVCGNLLAEGPRIFHDTNNNVIRLSGPELISLGDAVRIIGRVIGKSIGITEVDEQKGLEIYVDDFGIPESVGNGMLQAMRISSSDGGEHVLYPSHAYEEAKDNVRKYARGQFTTLHEWVAEHKDEFLT